MVPSGVEMARNSDSEDIELFRGKEVGSVEQYLAREDSADGNDIDGNGIIRWTKGRRATWLLGGRTQRSQAVRVHPFTFTFTPLLVISPY